jgi:hypothetical protein
VMLTRPATSRLRPDEAKAKDLTQGQGHRY